MDRADCVWLTYEPINGHARVSAVSGSHDKAAASTCLRLSRTRISSSLDKCPAAEGLRRAVGECLT